MMRFTKKITVFLVVFLALCGSTSQAQTSIEVLHLDSILDRIGRNNVLLQSFDLKASSYLHQGESKITWSAPMVGVGTYMTPYPGGKTMDPADKGTLMIQIEQAIPGKVKNAARKRAIQSLGEIEHVNRTIAFNDLKAQAKELYVDGIVAGKRIQLLSENLNIMKMMKEVEELRYTYNKGSLGNIYKLEGQLAETYSRIELEEGTIKQVKAILNSLMNRPVKTDFLLDSTYVPPRGLQESYSIDDLASQRADVVKMEKSIQSIQLDIEAVKLQSRPDFSIRFDHMAPLAKAGMANSYSIMGMISIPVAPWSSKSYREQVKALEYDRLSKEKEQVALLKQTQGLLYGLNDEIKSLDVQIQSIEKKVLPALEKSFNAYFVSYQENTLGLSVVLDAWEALLIMRMNALDKKLKLYELYINYEKEIYH